MHSIFHEGSEASVASSSSLLPSSSWWPPPVSSSSRIYQWQQQQQPAAAPPCGPVVVANLISSPSSYDEPSMDDSSADLPREPVADQNHLWNQVLVDDGRGVFEPTTAFDYLKQMDGNWEFNLNPNSSLSWFIAPPVPRHDRRHRQLMVGSDQKASTSGCFCEADVPWSLSDGIIPFDGCSVDAKRSLAELRPTVSSLEKGSESSTVLRSGEGKKKRSEETAESLKQSKMQVPKAKVAEKISALQQLVSPFGKTDQASVLMETITYIRILQEQVQLLSDPYLRDGEMKMKMKVESEMSELRSKGLCLVPVSSIPQLERDANGPEFWMPAFHSCLYR